MVSWENSMRRRCAQERRQINFPQGARLNDAKKLFNARLDSNTVRAIDFHKDDSVDEAALMALVLEAVELNE